MKNFTVTATLNININLTAENTIEAEKKATLIAKYIDLTIDTFFLKDYEIENFDEENIELVNSEINNIYLAETEND